MKLKHTITWSWLKSSYIVVLCKTILCDNFWDMLLKTWKLARKNYKQKFSQIISRMLQEAQKVVYYKQRYCISEIFSKIYFITDALLTFSWILNNLWASSGYSAIRLCATIVIATVCFHFYIFKGAMSAKLRNLTKSKFPLPYVAGWRLWLSSFVALRLTGLAYAIQVRHYLKQL